MIDGKKEKYHHVNSQWPEAMPELTADEAIAAARRLYRFAMKKTFAGKFQSATGNRFTWIRNGVFYVNPKRTAWGVVNGWHDLVHMISHLCHRRLHPTAKPHDARHHFLEKEMVAYVIRSGWLDGRLRRPATAATKPDRAAIERARVDAGIARWTSKLRRADTALKKLRRKKARLARRQPPEPSIAA